MKYARVGMVLLVTAIIATSGTGCRRRLGRVTPLPGWDSGRVGDRGERTGILDGTDRTSLANRGNPGNQNTMPISLPPAVGGGLTDPGLARSTPNPPSFIDPTSNPNTSTGVASTDRDFSNWIADTSRFKDETVYFDFDKSNVKPGEMSKIQAVANALRSMPGKAVRIEGHCDERGTEEYNRALGERRALSIREKLIGFGVPADLIPTISYGEDRPVDTAHDESAWRKNRRGEFILLSPP